MNFDETLSFLAADNIAEGMEHHPVSHTHRQGFFQILGLEEGLNSQGMHFVPFLTVPYDNHQFPFPDCTCPPWMGCYCGGRNS